MSNTKKQKEIQYTISGKKRIQGLRDYVHNRIEEEIRERKFVPGEELIEVTGSDIDGIKRSMQLLFRDGRPTRLMITDMVTRLYLIVGIAVTIAGVLYPYLDVILENPTQYILVGTGIGMSLVSMTMTYYARWRRQDREIENRIKQEREWFRRRERFTEDIHLRAKAEDHDLQAQ